MRAIERVSLCVCVCVFTSSVARFHNTFYTMPMVAVDVIWRHAAVVVLKVIKHTRATSVLYKHIYVLTHLCPTLRSD